MIVPVIMAGGSGTRLWPLSRTTFPKQFLALTSKLTMLQETAARLNGLSQSAPMVICNEEHRFLVAEQLRNDSSCGASIILEPVGRNTAPAIALAAFQALSDYESSKADSSDDAKSEESPVLLVLAADHVIENVTAFQDAVTLLLPAVQQGKFGTLGIVPTEAATGYGYIKSSPLCENQLLAVEQFVEKPDAKTAESYLCENADSNKWLWNSGMFLIRADSYLSALKTYRNDIYTACEKAMANVQQDMDFIRIDAKAFAACPDESIDYAVMEPLSSGRESVQGNGPSVVVAPLDAGWSDVGSWSALWEIADKDEQGNVSTGDSILQDTSNSYVYAQDRLITTLGVDNLVIVDTPDALLVAHKDSVQDIKKIVSKIKNSARSEHHSHREV
jgi:mannose-1-phosphate guanylyltransferase